MDNHLGSLLTCLLLVSCGSESSRVYDQCRERAGIYLRTAEIRTGNCGEIPEELLASSEDRDEESCQHDVVLSDDNCRVYSRLICGQFVDGGMLLVDSRTYDSEEVLTWDTGANSATGLYELTRYKDGVESCRGTYDVTYAGQ